MLTFHLCKLNLGVCRVVLHHTAAEVVPLDWFLHRVWFLHWTPPNMWLQMTTALRWDYIIIMLEQRLICWSYFTHFLLLGKFIHNLTSNKSYSVVGQYVFSHALFNAVYQYNIEIVSMYWHIVNTHTLCWPCAEEVGHCMLPYIRDQILVLVNESLLVVVLQFTEVDPSLIPEQNWTW